MTTSYRKQAILDAVKTEVSGNGYSHETVSVTVTATMGNGSLLAEGVEIAAAAAATADGILDDARFDEGFFAVGDVVTTRVAKGHCVANTKVIKFSDAAYGSEALTLLEGKGVILRPADTDFSRI